MTTGTFFSGCDRYYDRKKKIQSSVWRVRDQYYDRKKKRYSRLSGRCEIVITTGKKKVPVVCLAGARSLLRPENKKVPVVCLAGRWSLAIVITTRKKKDTVVCLAVGDRYYDRKKKVLVVCLAGARSLLRLEKKMFQSSVWRVRDCHYDWKKKSSSCLSGG